MPTALAKTDCFAYSIVVDDYISTQRVRAKCSALEEDRGYASRGFLLCMKQECPFYKKHSAYLEDLRNRHGTDDIEAILEEYKKSRQKIRNADKDSVGAEDTEVE